jgi:large subunit ribosomal protein L24
VKTRIRKGDTVQVRSGKDKGRRGRVLNVTPGDGRALVESINISRRHRRARGPRDQGGIVSMESPLPLSKLMLVSDEQPTRVRIEVGEDGTRRRVAVKTGKAL